MPVRSLLPVLLLLTLACAQRPVPSHHVPPVDPTQVVLGDTSYKQRRKSFHQERHRAPPGVDVQAVERANGAAQIARRNALAQLWSAVGSRWTERGSENLAGRMHVAAPGPSGASLYAGSSLGGVWRGTPLGTDWEPLGDNLAGGAHWLAVVPGALPTDPDVILAATDGGAIHRSADEGQTWTVPAGLPATVGVRRVLVRPGGAGTIFLLARWWQGGQLRNTIYRSTDRAQSFTKVLGLLDYWGDLWTPRDVAGPLYALKQGDLLVSHDEGDSWSLAGSLPVASEGGELVGSEAGAPRLWALVEAGGRQLYRSDDAGQSWSHVTAVSDYWGSLNASMVDPDLFAWGGVEVHRSDDGGASFAVVNNWWEYYGQEATQLHADIPGIDVVPGGPAGETWYVATDGGLYRSQDGLQTVENLSLSGLRVSQYYSTHTAKNDPDRILAGSQDQGYQRADTAPVGTTAYDFDQLISGDYGHLTSGDGTHAWVYSVYPGFVLVQNGAASPALFQVDFPANEEYGWMPTVVADPTDNQAWFFCARKLYRYSKAPLINSWSPVEWSAFDFAGSPGEYLTALAFSPADTQRAYAATNLGRLFWSSDRGLTWTESSSSGPSAHYFYGTAIVCDADDPDRVWVGGSGYGSPAVYRSTDGGQTFQNWGLGLPDTLVYCLAQAPDGSGSLYCGTETSAYRRDPDGGPWTDITENDAPVTIYWSVEPVASLGVMRFGTYGRGIWDYALDDDCGWTPYAAGLGGANTLALDSASSTVMGVPFTLDVTGAEPGAGGVLLAGTAGAQLAFKGGTLVIDPTGWLTVPLAADGSGAASLTLTVPPDPAWDGLEVFLQAALSATGQPGGWAFSNGLSGVLCP